MCRGLIIDIINVKCAETRPECVVLVRYNSVFIPLCSPNACKGVFNPNVMKALKCKPSEQFAYSYTINVLSKCNNIISHRSSVFEVNTTTIDLRRSAHRSSIFEVRHIYHRSSKVDTSIVNLRKLTPIFEGRHIDLRRSKAETSHRHSDNSSPNIVHNGAP